MTSSRWFVMATLAACTSNPSTPLGTGSLTLTNTPTRTSDGPVLITVAWAEVGYLAGNDGDRYGAILLSFATATPSGSSTCGERSALAATSVVLDLQTTDRSPSLSVGAIPFISWFDEPNPPTATVATIPNIYPAVNSGQVSITAFDDIHVAGTFDGIGDTTTESNHLTGAFDLPICD
jgi:hypothetical protein